MEALLHMVLTERECEGRYSTAQYRTDMGFSLCAASFITGQNLAIDGGCLMGYWMNAQPFNPQ